MPSAYEGTDIISYFHGVEIYHTATPYIISRKRYITENYYCCTKEILAGLGQMYVADERFKNNIDKHADGTAAFISEAIAVYCSK